MTLSDILAVAGALATLVSLCLTSYYYRRANRSRQFALVFTHADLQKRVHPDITISFKGEEIQTLSPMSFVIWNDGTQEIR